MATALASAALAASSKAALDRKSTRLNSSHSQISYADFCLKKKVGDAQRQLRAAAARRVLHRVLDELHHRTAQGDRVARHRGGRALLDANDHAPPVGDPPGDVGDLVEQRLHPDTLPGRRRRDTEAR